MRSARWTAGLMLGAWAVLAGNWPEWRGPTRDGVTTEQNLPARWSATENVRWKTPLPGPGNSTPIVWGDRVFVSQSEPGKRLLLCLDRKDGKILWAKGPNFNDQEETHEANPFCSSSPATDGKRVYAWFGSAGLFCYDFEGQELWHRSPGKQRHEWGYGSSPVIQGERVFLNFGPGQNSFLAGFDKNTGRELWRSEIEERHFKERPDGFNGQEKGVVGAWSTPIFVHAAGREELVMALPNKMSGFDPATGKEVWFARGLNPLIYASPVFGEGLIIANGGFRGPDMVVRPGGKGDVTATQKVWESGRTANRLGSGVIKDGYFFVPTMPGMAECIELKTGKTVWNERIRGRGAKNDIWSSFVLAGGTIYVVNQSGDTILLRASPKFEVLGVNSIGNEMCNASIAPAHGDLFIRTDANLWCISRTAQTASTFK